MVYTFTTSESMLWWKKSLDKILNIMGPAESEVKCWGCKVIIGQWMEVNKSKLVWFMYQGAKGVYKFGPEGI